MKVVDEFAKTVFADQTIQNLIDLETSKEGVDNLKVNFLQEVKLALWAFSMF